jgi:hypothetical protein
MNLNEAAQGGEVTKVEQVLWLLHQVKRTQEAIDTVRCDQALLEEVPQAVSILGEHKKGLVSQIKELVM